MLACATISSTNGTSLPVSHEKMIKVLRLHVANWLNPSPVSYLNFALDRAANNVYFPPLWLDDMFYVKNNHRWWREASCYWIQTLKSVWRRLWLWRWYVICFTHTLFHREPMSRAWNWLRLIPLVCILRVQGDRQSRSRRIWIFSFFSLLRVNKWCMWHISKKDDMKSCWKQLEELFFLALIQWRIKKVGK